MKDIWAAAKRAIRAGIAIAVPLAINWMQNSTDPTMMVIAPALMAAGKYLRDKYGWTWLPV